MDRLAALLPLDLGAWRHRVALYAAIRLAALPAPPPLLDRRLTLTAALDHPHARDWAAGVLGDLTSLQRATATAWMTSDRQPEVAAAALGIRRSTLYQRLSRIAAATRMPATTYPGPAAELALALAVAGDLQLGSLPSATRIPALPTAEMEADVDITKPHPARIYGYFVGSPVHFAADRAAAVQIQHTVPDAAAAAQSAHHFTARALTSIAEAGVDQVLDLTSAIPTTPAPHHVLQRYHPGARVAYVSPDPVVRAHSARLLHGTPEARTVSVAGTIGEGAALYDHPDIRETLDLTRPLALVDASLYFVTDDDQARRLLRELLEPLAPGSYLVINHLTADHSPSRAAQMATEYAQTVTPVRPRTQAEVAALLEGLDILPPGITASGDWRPDDGPALSAPRAHNWVAVARI